jgi:hypothetical protein
MPRLSAQNLGKEQGSHRDPRWITTCLQPAPHDAFMRCTSWPSRLRLQGYPSAVFYFAFTSIAIPL